MIEPRTVATLALAVRQVICVRNATLFAETTVRLFGTFKVQHADTFVSHLQIYKAFFGPDGVFLFRKVVTIKQ